MKHYLTTWTFKDQFWISYSKLVNILSMHKDQEISSKNFLSFLSFQITPIFGVISREKKFYLQQYPFTLFSTLLWITLNHLIISYIHTRHKQNSQRITHRNSIQFHHPLLSIFLARMIQVSPTTFLHFLSPHHRPPSQKGDRVTWKRWL